MPSRRTFRSIVVAILTAAALFVVGLGIVRNEARISQNDQIIRNQTVLLTEFRAESARADASRVKSDAALVKQVEQLLKITESTQETVEQKGSVRIITRTITRTRCVRPNGRPC